MFCGNCGAKNEDNAVFCGECGAKMRYQLWNKKTRESKVVCYPQQTSKKSLIKDKNCDNENGKHGIIKV